MVQYVDLNKPPKDMLAEALGRIDEQARKVQTGAHGVADLGLFGDITWTRTVDGRDISVREVDGALIEAQERIDQAVSDLAVTEERLKDAESLVEGVRDELDGIDWDSLGAEVHTEGPPPVDPIIGKTLWVSPSGRVFRAVECEEQA